MPVTPRNRLITWSGMAGLSTGHKVALWVAGIGAVGAVIAATITGVGQGGGGGKRTECSQNAICGDNNTGNSVNGDKNETAKP